jgi:hypothetical protein
MDNVASNTSRHIAATAWRQPGGAVSKRQEPVSLYIGTDQREAIGAAVFAHSVWSRATVPVQITALSEALGPLWGGQRDGSTRFGLARFLIPWFQGFSGWALYADGSDMVCLADLAELWSLRDSHMAVQLVMHDYAPKHPTKFLGQPNEAYPRKNWSSLMLINCGHYAWRRCTPDWVGSVSGETLHRFVWMDDARMGTLPAGWNWLDEFGPSDEAKLIHYTNGLPVWEPFDTWWCADAWREARARALHYDNE